MSFFKVNISKTIRTVPETDSLSEVRLAELEELLDLYKLVDDIAYTHGLSIEPRAAVTKTTQTVAINGEKAFDSDIEGYIQSDWTDLTDHAINELLDSLENYCWKVEQVL